METPQRSSRRPADVRELPIVAGHVALDFANTIDNPDNPRRFDHVIDYHGLLDWAARRGILPEVDTLRSASIAHPRRAAAAIRKAAQLRDALNAVFGAVVDGTGTQESWPRLRPFVAAAVQHATNASPQPAWDFTELESPLWPVANSAYSLLTDPALRKLRRCAGCPWLFLDQSRNSSRRWCSMDLCGTDHKINLYVAKRASSRRPETPELPKVHPQN
jgi:predicted RNA-binding Zn ribbon-like protein